MMTIGFPIVLTDCNPSFDARSEGVAERHYGPHAAAMTPELVGVLRRAYKTLDDIPEAECICLRPYGLWTDGLNDLFHDNETWFRGSEYLIVYRKAGVFLRLTHDDNRQAEIEFTLTVPRKGPLTRELLEREAQP